MHQPILFVTSEVIIVIIVNIIKENTQEQYCLMLFIHCAQNIYRGEINTTSLILSTLQQTPFQGPAKQISPLFPLWRNGG